MLDADEEAARESTFTHCKPLASGVYTQVCTPALAPDAACVLYGNEPFYIFFRLHHYIYDRYEGHLCA